MFVTPGHPTKAGAGFDCACGECLAARRELAESFVAKREEELRRLMAGLQPAELARVDLDTPEAVEAFVAQRRVEFRALVGLAA